MQEEEQILSEKLENKKDLKRALNTEDMIREDESITFYIKHTKKHIKYWDKQKNGRSYIHLS